MKTGAGSSLPVSLIAIAPGTVTHIYIKSHQFIINSFSSTVFAWRDSCSTDVKHFRCSKTVLSMFKIIDAIKNVLRSYHGSSTSLPRDTAMLARPCNGSRNSVCLSVTRVLCDKTKQCTANILIPHESAITPFFWHQQWLVGDAPLRLKFALKVTHPHSKNADFDRFPLMMSQP